MPIQFPQEVGLRDGRRAIVRPFSERDADALFGFFQRLPESLRRMAWDRIESRGTVEAWARDVDYDRAVPLLALDGTAIVASATLHYRETGPLRKVGRIRWLLDPAYRGSGIGTVLVDNFIEMARLNGLRHLSCTLAAGLEDDAVVTLKRVGFRETRLVGYGSDPDGKPVDMLLLILPL